MAVYYKFKSARDYDSIPIDGHFISVANLKERIFESKHLGRGTDFDLMVSNAQTDEEYVDEATLIPKNTSVLVRRIPGHLRRPIVTHENETRSVEDKVEMAQSKSVVPVSDSSTIKLPEESEWDEFGTDLYAMPEVLPSFPSNTGVNVPPQSHVDEDSKIKALVDTPALDWQRQAQDNFGPGRGFGRGMGGRLFPGRAFGRGGLERKTPPPGYVCHRCKVPGHLIQHCPTNGDPNFDIKRVKPPTGIPRSMLMATPEGSYALPGGAVAVLKPNEAAFEKEIEGLPSTRQVTDFPPELHCPLCKEVMKDAVLTSKCCFHSFCDKCIRDFIISKSTCVCGFANILTDDLLPNKTLRETISRIMESTTNSSADNAGSLVMAQDMESTRPPPSKVPSPTLSATKEEPVLPPLDPLSSVKEEVVENDVKQAIVTKPLQEKLAKPVNVSDKTPESASAKEPTSQESAPPGEEVQDKVPSTEQGKKKKKKKTRLPGNEAQWRPFQEMGMENGMAMPLGPSPYNPYVAGMTNMPWGMDGYMAPFPSAMPLMTFPQTPFDFPFGVLPHDPFTGQGYMMPPMLPQRDLSELSMAGMNMNAGPPNMTREDFGARKAEFRRRQESEIERERPRDRESGKDRNGVETSLKPRPKLTSQAAVMDRAERGRSPIRGKSPVRPSNSARESSRRTSSPPLAPPPRVAKRKLEEEEEAAARSKPDQKQKPSVFSRISFPGPGKDGGSKKRKSSEPPNGLKDTSQHSRRSSSTRDEPKPARSSPLRVSTRRGSYDHESSEEEYHFKRRPSSRHGDGEDEGRSSRNSRELAHENNHERAVKRR